MVNTVISGMRVMKALVNNFALLGLVSWCGILFGSEKSQDFESCWKEGKREREVEGGENVQRKRRMHQYLQSVFPKKHDLSGGERGILSCIHELPEEKQERRWEGDCKRMLGILEDEFPQEESRSLLSIDFLRDCSCALDEEDSELVTLHLHYRLMDIGIRQTSKDANPHCQGCGDPFIPWPFASTYDFNSKADAKGRSFLTRAIFFRHRELVDLLLSAGAGINRPDARGVVPLQEALEGDTLFNLSENDEESMVNFLVKRGAGMDFV